jgi:hypothetical protein
MMQEEIIASRNEDMALDTASETCNVPKVSLKKRLYGSNIDADDHIQTFERSAEIPKEIKGQSGKYVLLLIDFFFDKE